MAATIPMNLSKEVQQAFLDHHKICSTITEKQWNIRDRLKEIDLAYLRENDATFEQVRAKIANMLGDANRIQNITIPIIKPQVASAVTYQAGVFLSEYPIFGVISDPNYMDAAVQMEAILEENSIRGAWARELILFFYDGFKYNLSAIEACWKKVSTAAIETDLTFTGGKEGKPKEIIWQGNSLKRWDPYNMYFDTRCIPYEIPAKGEFAGYTELLSRTALKSLINSLDTKLIENVIPAFQSSSSFIGNDGGSYGASYHIPRLNPLALVDHTGDSDDWSAWAGLRAANNGAAIQHKGIYEVSHEYVRIIPSDFGLKVPSPNHPQVWKRIIVNHSVVIYAERQTNAHEKIPVFFGQPAEDGLGYQTKSLATDALPFQQAASALMNATIAGRRRAVTDRLLYDPSRVSEAQINSPNPSAKIPVRPSAYGTNIGEAVYAFPYRDDQAGMNMQEIQAIIGFANTLNSQNQVRQGQFVKGNKTDSQWDATMANATSKDQMTALLYESQVFTPLKEVLKLNTLQYQTAGTVTSPRDQKVVKVDPLALRQATINFKITDGLLPKSKVMSTDTLQVAMQVIGSSETLAQGYNIAPMFSYMMKTENADLSAFEKSPEQIAYESAVQTWTQLAQLSIQKGVPFNTPQPIPANYGFDPKTVTPAPESSLSGE